MRSLKSHQALKYSERVSYCLPLRESVDGRKPNEAPDVLWKIFERNRAIFKELANNWYVVFPDGNYMPEDSNDTHVMVSPNIEGEFSSIQTLSRAQLNPIGDMLLKFIKGAGPEGLAGYNVGTDFTRPTPQSWANLHIHMIERGELDYQQVESIRHLPKKLREPAAQHIASVAKFVIKNYEGTGIERLVDPIEGPFNGFPIAGSIVELKPNISGTELITILKHIDGFYSDLHRKIFTAFTNNYDEVKIAHGVVQYDLRSPEEIIRRLQLFNEEIGLNEDLGGVVKFLTRLARTVHKPDLAHTLKSWKEYTATRDENVDPIDNGLKVLAPPSYSIALTHRKGKSYMVFGIHILSEAGAHDILGTLTPRVYKVGESFTKRRARGRVLANKIETLFSDTSDEIGQ